MYTNIMEMFRKFEEAQQNTPKKKPEQPVVTKPSPNPRINQDVVESKQHSDWSRPLNEAAIALQNGMKDEAIATLRSLIQQHNDKTGFLLSVIELLSSHQFPKDAVKLILPVYKPAIHGVDLGYRLLNACVEARNKLMGNALLQNLRDSRLSQLDNYQLQLFEEKLSAL